MQGTYEFMSAKLLRSLRDHTTHYLHSPIDDLESFYRTAQWAAAFNNGAEGGKYEGDVIKQFRDMIAGQERNDATNMVRDELCDPTEKTMEEYGPFFAHSLPLLAEWFTKLVSLRLSWEKLVGEAAKLEDGEKKNLLHSGFLTHGYRGVAEYLELVNNHRESLMQEV